MTSILDQILAPTKTVMTAASELISPAQKAAVEHLANPLKTESAPQDDIIFKRFLQQFEHIDLDYNDAYGDLSHPERPLKTHPHIEFIMCSDERATMQPEQLIAYLSREVDRGNYMLKRLGITTGDFYINADDGLLRLDAKIPNPPPHVTEKQALESIVEGLQQLCAEARSERDSQMAIA